MEKYYMISGLKVKMDTFGKTEKQAYRYIIDRPDSVDIVIESSRDDWKARRPEMPIESCEYLSTGFNFYRQLLNFDGLMLHASAVVVDGNAYLFTANPGTGKSTHTKLWLNMFGDRAFILNDDKPALRLEDGIWYAYGTPWSGKHDISVNEKVPVAGIAFLERSDINEITPFTGLEAVRMIFTQVNSPKWKDYREKLLCLLDKLMRSTPVWRLKCNMEPEAAIVSYEAMSGLKFDKENLDED